MSVENINQELNQVANEYRVEFLEKGSDNWTSDAMTFETFKEAAQYGTDVMNGQLTTFTTFRIVPNSEPLDPPVV
jgi:hypothetical protein